MAFKWNLVFLTTLVVAKAQEGYPRETHGLRSQEGYPRETHGLESQEGYPRENPSSRLQYDSGHLAEEFAALSGGEIPGEADKDYPVLAEVPETRFSCDEQQYPGYYADPEARCQAFHICQTGGRKDSFLCPSGSIFSQEKLVCDWWYNFDCAKAEEYYAVNEAIVRAMEEAGMRNAQLKASEGYGYNGPNSLQDEDDIETLNEPIAKGARPSYSSQRPRPGHSHPVASARLTQKAEGPQGSFGAQRNPSVNADLRRDQAPFNGQFDQGHQGHSAALQTKEPARTYLPGNAEYSSVRGPASVNGQFDQGHQGHSAALQTKEPSRTYLPGNAAYINAQGSVPQLGQFAAVEIQEPARTYLPGNAERIEAHGPASTNGRFVQDPQGHSAALQTREPARTYLPGNAEYINAQGSVPQQGQFAALEIQEPARTYLPGNGEHVEANGKLVQGDQGHSAALEAQEPGRTYLPGNAGQDGITGARFAPLQTGQRPSQTYLPGKH